MTQIYSKIKEIFIENYVGDQLPYYQGFENINFNVEKPHEEKNGEISSRCISF